jgi:ATP-binding cassette subfamily C protein
MNRPAVHTLSREEQGTYDEGLGALRRLAEPAGILATAPVLLNGEICAWIVESGGVDIFAMPLRAGEAAGARTHVCRIGANSAVFGLRSAIDGSGAIAADHGLLAVALPATRWVRIDAAQTLLQTATHEGFALRCLADGWVSAFGPQLQGAPRPGRIAAESALAQLVDLHASILRGVEERRGALDAADAALLGNRHASEARAFGQSIAALAQVVSGTTAGSVAGPNGDALLAASQKVFTALGCKVRLTAKKPAATAVGADAKERIESLCRQARVAQRRVILDAAEWWKDISMPLLAFREGSSAPVALLPRASGRFVVFDPATGQETPLTPAVARGLERTALMFYRAFDNEVLTVAKLARFGLQGTAGDWWRVLLFGALGGMMGLLTPVATGILVDSVIPSANSSQLMQIVLLLTTTSIAIAAFELTRGLALMRAESGINRNNQPAVIDRLLRLPVPFFRKFAAADLAQRAFGIDAILRMLSSTVQSAVFGWLFGLFSFAYLFVIDVKLALLATALVLVSVLIATAVNFYRLKLQRQSYNVQGNIAALVLQLLNGMVKLRGGGAEKRAFVRWADAFAQQKTMDFKLRSLANGLAVFDSGYIVLCSLLLFTAVTFHAAGMSTGTFIAFNSAFGQFMAATLGMTSALTAMLGMVPLYERAKPIFAALPEVNEQRAAPGRLTGAIEFSGVSFRYASEGPMTLTDIDIRIEPGEFVAIVGPSGSGKSTLFRLLLGFETPASGGVYYDGQDLAGLDVQAVRRQLGVVLQNGKLMSGDIFTNIVGSAPLTHADAMRAVVMAGMEDDIKAMPMGLHTVVSEGAGTISGGQKQRLMVARAIVRKPRILLFDEATSALDNRTQAIVANSVSELKATRVVIAHRLSTVVNADRIIVVDAGRVIEMGTYDQLMQSKGAFAELARRQIA